MNQSRRSAGLAWIPWLLGLVLMLGLVVSGPWWSPVVAQVMGLPAPSAEKHHGNEEEPDDHAGHDHDDHEGHDDPNVVHLSDKAAKNIGLTTGPIKIQSYTRRLTVPARVVERPGQTRLAMAAPLTGIVKQVSVVRGQAVTSGELLFTLRLTHQDLVKVQSDYLETLEQRDVEQQELERLQTIGSGAVAGKLIIQQKYELAKIDGRLKAQRAALQLHGLSDQQLDDIVTRRELIRQVQVRAPYLHRDQSLHEESEPADYHPGPASPLKNVLHQPRIKNPITSIKYDQPGDNPDDHTFRQLYVVDQLNVHVGDSVNTGENLCVLANFAQLQIEGLAFEQDANALVASAKLDEPLSALVESTVYSTDDNSNQPGSDKKPSTNTANNHDLPKNIPGTEKYQVIPNLTLDYISNQINPTSRALPFYVNLSNVKVNDVEKPNGRRFVSWKYRPGQRMQLRIPVEKWNDVIVLPRGALIEQGPQAFVFVKKGDHFERREVHVKYLDRFNAVLTRDGAVLRGETVALTAAHQLQMALAQAAGGQTIDPHAGHNH